MPPFAAAVYQTLFINLRQLLQFRWPTGILLVNSKSVNTVETPGVIYIYIITVYHTKVRRGVNYCLIVFCNSGVENFRIKIT